MEKNGPNKLTPPKSGDWWKALLSNLFGGFAALLWVAAVLCFASYAASPDLAADNVHFFFVSSPFPLIF